MSSWVGAVTTAVLVGAALALVAPATAASGPLAYTCSVLGNSRGFTVLADTDAPLRLPFGATVAANAAVRITVPEDVTTAFRDVFGVRKIDGTADVAATVDGAATPWSLPIARVDLPASGPLTLDAYGAGGSFVGSKVGTVHRVATGNLTATLAFYDANGLPLSPVRGTAVVCTLNAGQDAAVDAVEVVKDRTATKVRARDISRGDKPKARITITSEHGKRPKGTVRVALRRKGTELRSKKVALERGTATVKFARLTDKGRYAVEVKYLKHKNFRRSKTKDAFRVGGR